MKKADDIIFSEIESDSDGYESFYRYREVVKAIKAAQIDAIDATVKRCAENAELSEIRNGSWAANYKKFNTAQGFILVDKQFILKLAEELKKELE